MSPSSAAAERGFSLLQAAVGNNQESMLEDQMEATLKLQYNHGRIALAAVVCLDLSWIENVPISP